LIGLASGIAIGMLFAPQSGGQTREGIQHKADAGARYMKERGEELRDSAGEMINKGKQVVGLAPEQVAEPSAVR
jgi:gas vesicle protein